MRGYHYDTLGYILNEILARHGYHFDPNGKYYHHFSNIDYLYPHCSGFPYEEAPAEVTNEEIISGLSKIEYKNLSLVKRIRNEKREANDESGFYADWCCYETPEELYFKSPYYFNDISLPYNLQLPVYSGPGKHYLRENNGKATVSTCQRIDACGFDGDWLMIAYLVDPDTDQTRVGYIHKDTFVRELNSNICNDPESEYPRETCYEHYTPFVQMSFAHTPMTLIADTPLTNDPYGISMPLADLKAGETVTYLASFPSDEDLDEHEQQWIYIEYASQPPMRGFIPAGMLQE